MTAQETMGTFTLENIPTLDVAVLGALELFIDKGLPPIRITQEPKIVLGSGNAHQVAQIIYADSDVIFGNESNYRRVLRENGDIKEVWVLSASGSKHAVEMVEVALAQGFSVHLVTNTEEAPAAAKLTVGQVHIFPKNREPYTYNTSTYLGPLLARKGEKPADIANFITEKLARSLLRNMGDYRAFTFILPDRFAPLCKMITTKFDELFGPMLTGRAFTQSEIMHAKTVIESGEELFIALGVKNEHFGLRRNRLEVALPNQFKAAGLMAVSYYIVGQIQRAHPPYFAKNLSVYCQRATQIFGQPIEPIVE